MLMNGRLKYITIATVAIFIASALLFVQPVAAEGTSIEFSEGGNPDNEDIYFEITLSDVPSTHELEDGTYNGWCFQKYVDIDQGVDYDATLYHSLDDTDDFPDKWDDVDMKKINYLINNRGDYSVKQTQNAIWHILGWSYGGGQADDLWDLIDDADDNDDFVPGDGELVAWLIDSEDDVQDVMFEVLIEEEEEKETDTAWAYGSSDTELWDLSKTLKNGKTKALTNKWGWYFMYEEGHGTESAPVEKTLYAGAGQNILSKGWIAGTVEIWDDGDTLYVTYMMEDDVDLVEAHIYAGEDAPDTAAPGQFPYNSDTEYEFEIDDLPEDWEELYIAIHGVAEY